MSEKHGEMSAIYANERFTAPFVEFAIVLIYMTIQKFYLE